MSDTVTLQQIDDTPDYNFIYNKMLVAVALLQADGYYLYFYGGGYDDRTDNHIHQIRY